MKHIVTFLFCIGLLAGCSQPRHETLVYYYPVVAETTQIPLTGDTAKTGQAAQATTQTNQTAAPVQTAVTTQTPVNITTLYPAPLPYTGTVETYYTPAPQIHLFLGPSFGFWHHRHHYRHYPHRRYYPHRGYHHRRWR